MNHAFRKILSFAVLGLPTIAFAHGLIQDPPSRNWICGATTKPDQIAAGTAATPACKGAFADDFSGGYQFMSVLTNARGRAAVIPLPKNVCGFDSKTWKGEATPWDKAIDWPTNKMTAGRKKFTWNISWGPHFDDSEEFRYWITKPDFKFQAGTPLSWTDFEEKAFCELKYDDKNPGVNPDVVPEKAAAQFHTYCTIPPREGRHVIYAEWGRNQYTLERFHGCIDAAFDGTAGGAVSVESKIQLQPNVVPVTGAGVVTLDGSASLGSGLSYQWSVDAGNASGYRLENATLSTARLTLENPVAARQIRVSLLVTNSSGSSSASTQFMQVPGTAAPGPAPTPSPAPAAKLTDLGLLAMVPKALSVGDTVSVRAVLKNGQDQYFPSQPLVITAANAGVEAWPAALAQAINALNSGVRIGVLNSAGQVLPATGADNRIFATEASGIANAFLQIQASSPVTATYQINSDWRDGYCATVRVTNEADAAVEWNTSLRVDGRINQLWNGDWKQAGDMVSLSGPSWARTLQAKSSFTQAGFCATRVK